MIRLGGLVNQKTFGKFEQGKVYSNPFATAFVNEGVDMDKLEFELKHLKKSNPGKKVGYHFIKSSEYPNGYYFTVNKKIIKNIFKNEAEGSEDHEVSMAQNSLDTIIKNATELKQKIGEMEKNIPGWIQDHITNSENYIEQANSGYHEINEGKINELAPSDVHVKQIMNFYDKGTYSTKKAVSIYVSGKANANRNQILDDLGDMGYNDIWDVMDHFKLTTESVNEAAPCWKGYTQYGMKDKNGKQVPNCVPNESIVKEGRGVKSIQNDLNKTLLAIEAELSQYKKTKGTPEQQKHIDNLKKLHPLKKKYENELDSTVSGLYKDAELKIED